MTSLDFKAKFFMQKRVLTHKVARLMIMTRRASAVLPESNTGEDRICPAQLPYQCVIAAPLIELSSWLLCRNELSSSESSSLIISFRLVQVSLRSVHFTQPNFSAKVRHMIPDSYEN